MTTGVIYDVHFYCRSNKGRTHYLGCYEKLVEHEEPNESFVELIYEKLDELKKFDFTKSFKTKEIVRRFNSNDRTMIFVWIGNKIPLIKILSTEKISLKVNLGKVRAYHYLFNLNAIPHLNSVRLFQEIVSYYLALCTKSEYESIMKEKRTFVCNFYPLSYNSLPQCYVYLVNYNPTIIKPDNFITFRMDNQMYFIKKLALQYRSFIRKEDIIQ